MLTRDARAEPGASNRRCKNSGTYKRKARYKDGLPGCSQKASNTMEVIAYVDNELIVLDLPTEAGLPKYISWKGQIYELYSSGESETPEYKRFTQQIVPLSISQAAYQVPELD